MHVLNGLGFHLGADFGAGIEAAVIQPVTQGLIALPTSRFTGRQVLLVDKAGNTAGSGSAVAEVDAKTGEIRDSQTGQVLESGQSEIPWLWIAGGLGLAGAAWYFMRKK